MNSNSIVSHRVVQFLLAAVLVLSAMSFQGAFPDAASAVTISNVKGIVQSPDGVLKLRTKPSASAPLIKALKNGTTLTIIATSGDWFKVTTGGKTGYVSSWYVRLSGTRSVEIARGNTSRKMIALTFDAGSDLGSTERILAILEQYNIKASFGLTGEWISAFPDYAAWIAADGHQIINHTLNHPSFTGVSTGKGALSPARQLSQIVANESKIKNVTGVGAKPYWRPPYGDINTSVLTNAGAAGYSKTVMWSIDSMGWNGYSADQIYTRVVNNAGNGSIVLMHVGSDSADASALVRIIKTLRSRGYAFGTVAKVIAA